jgi:hypothetical protein
MIKCKINQDRQVTANNPDNHNETGNNKTMIRAGYKDPKAAAIEASITIRAITPALTALPIFFPVGWRMAATRGGKIIQKKRSRKTAVRAWVCILHAKYKIAAPTRR